MLLRYALDETRAYEIPLPSSVQSEKTPARNLEPVEAHLYLLVPTQSSQHSISVPGPEFS